MKMQKETEEISGGRRLYLYTFTEEGAEASGEKEPQVDSPTPRDTQEQDNE